MGYSVGQILPIRVSLHNDDATKFVRATIKKANFTHMTGSPFALTNLGGGIYGLETVAMPDTAFVSVEYEVFNNSGFTDKDSEGHIDGYQYFSKSDLSNALTELLNAAKGALVVGKTTDQGSLHGIITSSQLIGVIENEDELTGVSDSGGVSGSVVDDGSIGGISGC